MAMAADQELVKRQEILDKSQRRQMGVEIRRRWGGCHVVAQLDLSPSRQQRNIVDQCARRKLTHSHGLLIVIDKQLDLHSDIEK